jgi:uncharacterized protein
MTSSQQAPSRRFSAVARALGLFWIVMLVGAGAGAGALQWLGPPPQPHAMREATPSTAALAPVAAPSVPAAPAALPSVPAAPAALPSGSGPARSGPWPGPPIPRSAAGQIAPHPDQTAVTANPPPMLAYASAFDLSDPHPRVALVVTGLGLSAAASRQAIADLPPEVALAFSPYGADLAPLIADARAHDHEILASIPMEPAGYPLDDPGPHALLTGASPAGNARNLAWALSQVTDAVGAIGALDAMRGERYAAIGPDFATLQTSLAARGLLYIDPRPGAGAPTLVPGRDVDLVVDDPPSREDIAAHLAALERLARDHGSALGFAGPVRPVTVEQIKAWAAGLVARGIALAPVTALLPPAKSGNPR